MVCAGSSDIKTTMYWRQNTITTYFGGSLKSAIFMEKNITTSIIYFVVTKKGKTL